MRHKNTSLQPVPLASGRVLAPGDITRDNELLDEGRVDSADQGRVDAGHLTEIIERAPDEPFAGYADATVDTIRDRIAASPEDDREALKAALRDAESKRDKPRQGVIDATEPDEATQPADETGETAEKEPNA